MPQQDSGVDRPRPASTELDAALTRRWLDLATEGLLASRAAIDLLNVYPVPDGDTGTNLHLTLARARQELDGHQEGETVGAVARSAARGALLGARGNSGVILSQLLHGWADALDGVRSAGPGLVAAALARADEQAWVAVESPAEGTILSVSRAAARAAVARGDHGDLAEVVTAAAVAAREALRRTTGQLDVLARAGVVDAGAAGLVLVLDALVAVVTGAPPSPPCGIEGGAGDADAGDADGDEGGPVEVMYLLEARDEAVPALRARLAAVGGSVVVVGGAGLWNVHVHTDEPDAAVEAGAAVGRPHEVTLTALPGPPRRTLSAAEGSSGDTGQPVDGVRDPVRDHGARVVVLAWATGRGLADAFRAAGAVPVLAPDGGCPTLEQLVDAVVSTGSRSVVILPNDPAVHAVARRAAEAATSEGVQVVVVAALTQVEGLAAAAVHDAATSLAADSDAMSAAAGHVRSGSVTSAGPVPAATGLVGSVDGDVVAVGADLEGVAVDVLGRLLATGGELVTLVWGAGTPTATCDAVAAWVRGLRPGIEVVVLDGGQPGLPLLVGVE